MNFNVSLFSYDSWQPDSDSNYTELFITYNKQEATMFFKKINFINEFKTIVLNNNGEFDKSDDGFFEEKDVNNAISELKEILKDELYSNFLIKSAIIKYIEKKELNVKNEKDLIKLYNHFSELDKDYIHFLLP